MSLNSRDGVFEQLVKCWENNLVEGFLEVFGHIVSHLTNAMKGSISNLRVRVLKMLNDNWDHWSDLLNVIKVLSNL